MIRFALRASGFLAIAAAFAALVVDGSRSIAGGHLMQYTLDDAAAWLGGARGGAALGAVAAWPAPARAAAAALLAAPAWLAAAALGLALLHLGRPGPRSVGLGRGRS